MNNPIRVRIAPSPTGNLHVGTARAALFNELFAKHADGVFIVRIEDTDKTRSKPEFEKNILEGLAWLGLTWQEGPDVGGAYGPYRQSERVDSYTKAITELLEKNLAYYCNCPPATPEKPRQNPCPCSTTPIKDTARAVIRLRVTPQEVSFTDLIRGTVTTHTDSFGGDFVIARSINDPVFHLAVVVDDATMDITHVIRGEDHVSNTARHILIQRALGYKEPIYAHLPLLLDEKRRKLSKRNGETSLSAYKEMGYLPEAMLNYLALLGWNAKDDREFFTHDELIREFTLDGVQKSGAVFSIEKLQAVNKHYIRTLSPDELLERTKPFFEKEGISIEDTELTKKALATEQERVATLAELPQAIAFFLPEWQAVYEGKLLIWRKSDRETTKKLITILIDKLKNIPEEDFTPKTLETALLSWIDENNLGRGDTLWPMRVAITGKEHSPGPFEVAPIIGKTKTIDRLEKALQLL